MELGFIRVGAATPDVKIADCSYNARRIISLIKEANNKDVQILVFPELSITGYTCSDLFHQDTLIRQAEKALGNILEATEDTEIVSIAGMPIYSENSLYNCGIVFQSGKILAVIPKSYIPGYKEYYEERWFMGASGFEKSLVRLCGFDTPFGTDILLKARGNNRLIFGVELCEDLWVPVPPSSWQSMAGSLITFNLSASNELVGKSEYRRNLVAQQSGRCIGGYVYSSSGISESTTDVVFGGHSIIAENGFIISQSERFFNEGTFIFTEIDIDRLQNDRLRNTSFMENNNKRQFRTVEFELKGKFSQLTRQISPFPFVPADNSERDERCSEIFNIQTCGLIKRLKHTAIQKALIGISGGLDSTLALLVTVKAFEMLSLPVENIIAVTMPGFGTTPGTLENSRNLMKAFGVTSLEIDIKEACLKHFKDIGHDPSIYDVTYENVQARERTQILMDLANKHGGLVTGTGDLSEMALGWSTYNGDHMSMYAINCGVPKTLVRFLVEWIAKNEISKAGREVMEKILNTPITPELLPPDINGAIEQKTEEIIGPYELHDFFLYHMIRYGAPPKKIVFLASYAFGGKYNESEIIRWLNVFYKRFFSQQFKRSCVPDGPKVGTISLSPRGDWRMPSDASAALWLEELGE